jgi:membrane protein DedA with SNARE-associated domain
MALETVVFPIPSEVVMPLAGWKLIDEGEWWWIPVAGVFGAIGSTLGAIALYWAARAGGRPLVKRWGKYFLISHDDIDQADRFFDRWGTWAIFFGRMVPLVRSLVSVPAGIVEMPVMRFTIYTFLGSFVWACGLAAAGYAVGSRYEEIRDWMGPADYVVAAALAAFLIWYVYRHVKKVMNEDGGPEAADRAEQLP